MNLVRLVDAYGKIYYIDTNLIHCIRQLTPLADDPYKSSIAYGQDYLNCVYMKESVDEVYKIITGKYFD